MSASYNDIQELLQQRADYQARLNLMPYDGNPEVKEQNGAKYIYIRKRVAGKLTSTYVDVYSEELYQVLLRNAREARELNKAIRKINKQLAEHGYEDAELEPRIVQNLEFARANMKSNIYDQAVLEGIATSYPQTEDIIDNGIVNGVFATDVQKILNLKHAWEFVLDPDVIQSKSNYHMLSHIARLVNEGIFQNGGRIRGVPVRIGGSKYVPPIPIETIVIDDIEILKEQDKEPIDIAIDLCLYCMKKQIFIDGNKRAAVIFANHYLIANGNGLLVIPEKSVPEFKSLLIEFYERDMVSGTEDGCCGIALEEDPYQTICEFLKDNCWKTF